MDELLQDIDALKSIMITVSTGGGLIPDFNERYINLYRKTSKELRHKGLKNPNQYSDLWQWHGKWSSGEMPKYAQRRVYIHSLYSELIQQLSETHGTHEELDITLEGWDRIDRTVGEIKYRLSVARNEEQFQAIGVLCRDLIISLAQQVYNRELHPPTDHIEPSNTDSKRMLDAYFTVVLAGQQNKSIRRYAKACNTLANDLTHNRTATLKLAKLSCSASINLVNLVRIIEE